MNHCSGILELLATHILNENSNGNSKPNYSNRDFMNACIIFQNALMDKMYDLQDAENIAQDDRLNMAENAGYELRRLIKTYTGLDTHQHENFLI